MTAVLHWYATDVHKAIAQLYGEREYMSWFSEEEYLKKFDPGELEYRSWDSKKATSMGGRI